MPTTFLLSYFLTKKASFPITHLLLLVKSMQVERLRRKSNQHIENALAFHKFHFAFNGVSPDST